MPAFLDAPQTIAGMQVSLANAFSQNDGPPPYTVLSADPIIDTQQAIFDLQVSSLSPTQSQMNAVIQPSVLLLYQDGVGTTRSKFINFPIAVTQSFAPPTSPGSINFFIALQSATITNISVSGTTLNFTASLVLSTLGFVNQPQYFAVLPDFTCAAPPPGYPTTCTSLFRLRSVCDISMGAPRTAIIPFRQEGIPPYSVASVSPSGVIPNVIFVGDTPEGLDMQVSFPAVLTFTDSASQVFTQNVFIYLSFEVQGPTLEAGEVVFADFAITGILRPVYVGTSFVVTILSIAGRLTVLRNHAEQVVTTPLVTCGSFPVGDTCLISPPTTLTETIPTLI